MEIIFQAMDCAKFLKCASAGTCSLLSLLGAEMVKGSGRPNRAMFSNFESIHYPDELQRPNVRAIAESQSEPMVWIGSDSGLISWDGNRIKERIEKPVTVLQFDQLHWLWVGTESSGLYRMYTDQREAAHYPAGAAENSLIDDHVHCIAEGTVSIDTSNGKEQKTVGLWVATSHGLHTVTATDLQKKDFEITRIQQTSAKPNMGKKRAARFPDSGTILSLLPTEDELWMGTRGGKLQRRDLRSGNTITVHELGIPVTSLAWLSPPKKNRKDRKAQKPQKEKSGAIADDVSEAASDNGSTQPAKEQIKPSPRILLIGTDGQGILRYDSSTGTVSVLANGLDNGTVSSLTVDSSGTVWAGTRSGLARLNYGAENFQTYRDQNSSTALIGDEVECVHLRSGKELLWVGTTFGVSMLDTAHRSFAHHQPVSTNPEGLAGRIVTGFAASGDPNSIFACTNRALEHLDLQTNRVIKRYSNDGGSVQINTALTDSSGTLWLGTDSGLSVRTPGDDNFRPVSREQLQAPVTSLMEDSQGRIWIGTHSSGVAVRSRTPENGPQLRFVLRESGGEAPIVTALHEGDANTVWVGTSGDGLIQIDAASGKTTLFGKNGNSVSGFDADFVNTIVSDKNGNLWIATGDRGLLRKDAITNQFRRYRALSTPRLGRIPATSVEIPSDVRAALIDQSDNLWITTNNRLIVQFAEDLKTQIFTASDGLQESFLEGSAFVAPNGELFFGGKAGFNVVNPTKLPDVSFAIAALTGLELFGEPVDPGPGKVIERKLSLLDRIELDHEQNRVGFTFSTPGFGSFGRTSYRYRMHGYKNQTWITAQTGRRDAQYALDPGEYEFEVEASLDGRSWNGGPPLAVIVYPPWHQRTWAKIGGVVGILIALVGVMKWHMVSINRRQERFQAEQVKAEAALARELQQSMLIEGEPTVASRSSDTQKIFHSSLQQLGAFLAANRCRLWKLDHAGNGQIAGARACANFFADESDDMGTNAVLSADHPWLQHVVSNDAPLALTDLDPGSSEQFAGSSSVLAVRTNYLEKPNGVIFIERSHDRKKWQAEEIELVSSVAGQIGLALAQLDLSEKEETHRLELVEAKQSAEVANSAKSEFLAKMTHELRTPLNAILGFCQVLCSDTDTSESQRDTLNIINRSGEHLLDIINDVLEMSKIEAGKTDLRRDRFEVKRLIDSVHEMLQVKADEKALDLRVSLESDLPREAYGDRSKIRQILVNLMGNAVKFTNSGFIELRLRAEKKSEKITILHFALEDSGRGIEAHELPSLFEKFAQTETGRTSHQGTGLGLAITRHFIELMGGTIQAKSDYGKGTTFEFSIECEPIAASEEDTNVQTEVLDKAVASLAPGQEAPTILIVEDQPVNRILLKRVLSKAGFVVREAENGKIASDRWREFAPDLIFMDQDMPIMNGNEATQSIIAQAGGIENAPPIVALTAYTLEDTRRAAIGAGCRDFLTKPFKHTEMFALVARLLKVKYVFQDELADKNLAQTKTKRAQKEHKLAFPD